MNSAIKILGIAAGVFGLQFLLRTNRAIDGLKVYITNPTNIRVSGGMLKVDAMVNVGNASAHPLKLTALQVDALRLSGSAWVEFASTAPSLAHLNFPAFETTRFPVTIQTSASDIAMSAWDIFQQKGLIKTKFRITPTFLNMRMAPFYSDVYELKLSSVL